MRLRFIIALVFLASGIQAQNLVDINTSRFDKTRKGMLVLGSWATANMIASPLLKQQANGSDRYFYDMNMYWNAMNLIIAGFGYYNVRKEDPSSYNLSASIQQQQQTEKILLLNSGLDFAYIMTGLYLREKGLNENSDRWKGYGESLILQGSFLAVFDVLFYISHRQNSKLLNALMESVSLGPNGLGLRIKL